MEAALLGRCLLRAGSTRWPLAPVGLRPWGSSVGSTLWQGMQRAYFLWVRAWPACVHRTGWVPEPVLGVCQGEEAGAPLCGGAPWGLIAA